jgi:hypothetical protein
MSRATTSEPDTDYGAMLFSFLQNSSPIRSELNNICESGQESILDMRCRLTCTSYYICGSVAAGLCSVRKLWAKEMA